MELGIWLCGNRKDLNSRSEYLNLSLLVRPLAGVTLKFPFSDFPHVKIGDSLPSMRRLC